MDPSSPSTLYAGASPAVTGGAGGVFRSTDGGQTWTSLGSGLSTASVTALAFDPSGGILHAGTHGGAVAELSIVPDRLPAQPPTSRVHRTGQIAPR
jgi:hypothetical protein